MTNYWTEENETTTKMEIPPGETLHERTYRVVGKTIPGKEKISIMCVASSLLSPELLGADFARTVKIKLRQAGYPEGTEVEQETA